MLSICRNCTHYTELAICTNCGGTNLIALEQPQEADEVLEMRIIALTTTIKHQNTPPEAV